MRGLSPPWAQDTSERKNTQGRLVATAQRHCRPRRLWELLYPPHPSPHKAHSGQEASSCARSSFTDQGGQPRIPGSGAGRRGAAGPEEGAAGWSHTATRALGCGTEGLAPRSPASLGQSFPYLQRRGKKRLQEWSTAPLSLDQATLFLSPYPEPISASRNGLPPWGAEGMLGRELALTLTWVQTPNHLPAPCPQPRLLRAPYSKSSRASP